MQLKKFISIEERLPGTTYDAIFDIVIKKPNDTFEILYDYVYINETYGFQQIDYYFMAIYELTYSIREITHWYKH